MRPMKEIPKSTKSANCQKKGVTRGFCIDICSVHLNDPSDVHAVSTFFDLIVEAHNIIKDNKSRGLHKNVYLCFRHNN